MLLFSFADTRPETPNQGPAAQASPAVVRAEAPGAEAPVADTSANLLADDASHEVAEVLMKLLPWGISILLHVGVIMLTIFFAWTTRVTSEEEELPVVTTAVTERAEFKLTLSTPVPVDATNVGRGVTASSGFQGLVKPPPGMVVDVSPGGGGEGEGWGPGKGGGVGWGKGKGGGSGLIGIGGGSGGGGGSGKGSPYGLREGGGVPAGMFGLKPRDGAKRIVYVIDASGSLIDTLPFVLDELRRSVEGLHDQQRFTVIFFQDDKVVEFPPPGPKIADEQTKKRLSDWIDPKAGAIAPQGVTSPLPAIRRALSYNPEVVYILSDNITGRGRYELNQAEVVNDVVKAAGSNAKINTIQFIYPDPLTAYGMKATLELISEKTGGIYKLVTANDLGLRK